MDDLVSFTRCCDFYRPPRKVIFLQGCVSHFVHWGMRDRGRARWSEAGHALGGWGCMIGMQCGGHAWRDCGGGGGCMGGGDVHEKNQLANGRYASY